MTYLSEWVFKNSPVIRQPPWTLHDEMGICISFSSSIVSQDFPLIQLFSTPSLKKKQFLTIKIAFTNKCYTRQDYRFKSGSQQCFRYKYHQSIQFPTREVGSQPGLSNFSVAKFSSRYNIWLHEKREIVKTTENNGDLQWRKVF